MQMAEPAGGTVRFRPTNGRVVGILGLVVCVVIAAGFAASMSARPAASGILACALGAVLIWAAMLRPNVYAVTGELRMTTLFETVTIPLASIENVIVRRYLVVRSGGKKYICPAISRSLRKTVRAEMKWTGGTRGIPGTPNVEERAGGLATHLNKDQDLAYADFVEQRIQALASEDRAKRGIEARSEEEYELGSQVVRRTAWPVIIALSVLLVAFVVSLFV
jgi:hypothetical protein